MDFKDTKDKGLPTQKIDYKKLTGVIKVKNPDVYEKLSLSRTKRENKITSKYSDLGTSTSRRSFLSKIGLAISSLATIPTIGRSTQTPIEIGIYVTERATSEYGADNAMELSRTVQEKFATVFPNRDLHIGPASIVETPDRTTWDIARADAWWEDYDGDYNDTNLLVFSKELVDWSSAFGISELRKPNAVCLGYERMDEKLFKQLALHEIGHTWGLDHYHGEVTNGNATIMKCCIDKYEPEIRFSDDSKSKLR